MHHSGCLVCGDQLIYEEHAKTHTCHICQATYSTNARCRAGHFVCDACHGADASEYIYTFCLHTRETDPMVMAISIMKHPAVNMHGPEHHFLVPAVLATAYCKTSAELEALPQFLETIRERSQSVPGGFCGFFGNCGAAVGTGMFLSALLGATPLSEKEWRLCNLMTAQSLKAIANAGGPRCCKRNTFLAITQAVAFLQEHLDIVLPVSRTDCTFYEMNNECLENACRYFKEK